MRSRPRPRGLGDLLAQPGRAAPARPSRSVRAVSCRVCADVAQVGQQPLAADSAEHPRGQPAPRSRPRAGPRRPRPRSSSQPSRAAGRRLVGERRRRARRARRRCARRSGSGRRRAPGRAAVRLLERLEQRQPLVAAGRREHAAAAARPPRGRRRSASARLHRVGLVRSPVADHRDVARPQRPAVDQVAPEASSAAMSAARSRGDRRPHLRRPAAHPPLAGAEKSCAPDAPASGTARRGRPARRLPVVVRPRRRGPRSARRRARRRASTPGGRRPGRRRCASWSSRVCWVVAVAAAREVGDHVAAAEGVDGLLGVADQHHRRVAAERPVEHLPLHGVGVLELVDQHDLPALPHPLARPAASSSASASASRPSRSS